jgi:hypothetical protein
MVNDTGRRRGCASGVVAAGGDRAGKSMKSEELSMMLRRLCQVAKCRVEANLEDGSRLAWARYRA